MHIYSSATVGEGWGAETIFCPPTFLDSVLIGIVEHIF